jgi:precorrin-2/cobalt-factor-2 C20-methyltransferase
MQVGTLYVVGLGPGDPELMTLKAARIIAAAPVIAFFTGRGKPGRARAIVDGLIGPAIEELRLEYPFTTEVAVADPAYAAELDAFYEVAAATIADRLEGGRDVALLCVGDPFFYGSSLAMLDRLVGRYPHEVVPGVLGMSGCWARAGLQMVHGDDVLSVLPGTLKQDALVDRLAASDAAVIMKVGRNLGKIRTSLARVGLLDRAVYVENGTTACERIMPLAQMAEPAAPYFSLVLVPGRQRRR